MAERPGAQSPAPHVADSHDVIHVLGAGVDSLKDVSVGIPKRRLVAFTGVSGRRLSWSEVQSSILRTRRSTTEASTRPRFDTAAVLTREDPWNVPGNWCSSTDTPD